MERLVEFKEAVELFLTDTIPELKSEEEVPNVNFIFPQVAFELFEYVRDNPFELEYAWTPNIKDKDIERLQSHNQQVQDCPMIYVKDTVRFFEYLVDITNQLYKQNKEYFDSMRPRRILICVMRRIWLRMGDTDFHHVEQFLDRQLSALKNDYFENYKEAKVIGQYMGYQITASNFINSTYCESNYSMTFELRDENGNCHTLPKILYDIVSEDGKDVCYISAVQSSKYKKHNPKIQRKIYKTSKGIDNPNCILSLRFFLGMLRTYGIHDLKIPTLQVLSYRYHEILSANVKEEFESTYTDDYFERQQYLSESKREYNLKSYEEEKRWYDHVVGKQDFISENKSEKLIDKIFRMQEEGEIEILNMPFIEDENISARLVK